MWAGGRFTFARPLRIGEAIARTSRILDVSLKEGRMGPLVFVLVRHELAGPDGPALTEEHDIVYRSAPSPHEALPAGRAAPQTAAWRRDIVADPVLLFRYSALTFNAHRIHYDRRYAMQSEFYPGLVVHGPLQATLLADLLRRNGASDLASFRFRAVRPLFEGSNFAVCGTPATDQISLWVQDANGVLAMEAQAVPAAAS
jgi:3-methylfumaryl-CoA hydratase